LHRGFIRLWWRGYTDFSASAALLETVKMVGDQRFCRQNGAVRAHVETGEQVELVERKFPEWTVIVAHELMYDPEADIKRIKALMACALLSESWRDALSKKIKKQKDK
jgi:hypothetical protein